MSAIVGERDKTLRGTVPRNINPTLGKSLSLDVDPPAFHQNSAGIPTIPSATFTATPNGFAATVLWSITSGGKLTGATPNQRTLLFSDMTSATVKVTATVVYDGQAYIAVRTFYKVTDGKDGKDADPADLSPESLAALLEGQITESQLYADLKSKIDLITDPVTVPGSVQQLIKAETDDRVAAIGGAIQTSSDAIDKEVSDRIAAVLAEAGARTTYVQNYTFSQQQINSALSIQATQIAAGYTAYVDQQTGGILSTAAADVRNYSYSKADTTSAISASETRLRAEFNAAGNVTMADIQNWSYSKAATDSAEAAQTATITTSFQGYADQKKSEATTAAAADVRNYAYSKSAVDAAEAAQSNTLTTNYTAYADAARTNAISAASADVRSYAYSKSAVDSSISAAIQELRSEFVGSSGATEGYVTNYAYSRSDIDQAEALQSSTLTTNFTNAISAAQTTTLATAQANVQQYAYSKSAVDGAISSLSSQLTASYKSYADGGDARAITAAAADVRNYTYAKATIDGAIAQSTSSLTTTVGQNTATLQAQGQSINGLSTQLTLKSDINGYVTGIGLASSAAGATPTSAFIVMAGAFSFVLPGGTPQPVFTIGQVGGQTKGVLRGDLIADGSITTSKLIVGGSPDNIVPDPGFRDLAWWGLDNLVGSTVLDFTGQNTPWKTARCLRLLPEAGAVGRNTAWFPMTPGAMYLAEFQTYITNEFVGSLDVIWHIPGVVYHRMGAPGSFTQDSPKGIAKWSALMTVPAQGDTYRTQFIFQGNISAGEFQFGDVSLTRVTDSTIIGPGVVQTKHLAIASGGDISSGQWGFDLGNGFWLEGAGNGHGARFSIGNSAGKKIICDPQNNILGLFNADIVNPGLAQKVVTGLSSVLGANGYPNGTTQNLGTQAATMTNATGAVQYSWSAEAYAGTITLQPNGNTCTIFAKAPNNTRCQGQVICIGTDSVGFSAGGELTIDVGFGSGVPS